MIKKENGITLISLVVTIVLMIILSSIVLIADTDNNDAIKLANDKKAEVELLSIKEKIKSELAENPPKTREELINALRKYGEIVNEDNNITAKLITNEGKYEIYIKNIWNVNALKVE